jgi:hypothetical protein
MTFPHPIWSITSGAQLFAELLFGAVALATLVYCATVTRREGRIWPLAVFAGGALTVTYEPFNNLLGHCAYPLIGQHTAIDFLGQKIPWFIVFVYAFYFAAPITWLMTRYAAGITSRQLVRYYCVGVVICAAFEPAFTHAGDWKYTGVQPFNMTGLPMWWWFVNPMCLFAIAAILHLFKQHLLRADWESLVFILLVPLGCFATHGSASVPLFIGINAHSLALADVGTFGSIALALMYMGFVGRAVCIPAEARAAAPSVPEPAKRPPVAVPRVAA